MPGCLSKFDAIAASIRCLIRIFPSIGAKINLNGKMLTFHCFRKMFLSTSVDVGMLTAGKMLCGKARAN